MNMAGKYKRRQSFRKFCKGSDRQESDKARHSRRRISKYKYNVYIFIRIVGHFILLLCTLFRIRRLWKFKLFRARNETWVGIIHKSIPGGVDRTTLTRGEKVVKYSHKVVNKYTQRNIIYRKRSKRVKYNIV